MAQPFRERSSATLSDLQQEAPVARKYPDQGVQPSSVEDLISQLHFSDDPLWQLVRFEADMSAAQDDKVSGFLRERVLAHRGIHTAAKEYLATKLHTPSLPLQKLKSLIDIVYGDQPDIVRDLRDDLLVSAMRDSSMPSLLSAFLFAKGYHAVTTYRLSNHIYRQGRESLARYLQSLNSELFGADIHPACHVGRALFISRGTCVVIGETARLGDDVVIMQGVTLGGNGKERGDRHPKLGSGVLVAAGSTVLGNIDVGDGVIVSAGSVVLRPLPEYSKSSGVPAKVEGVLRQHRDHLQAVLKEGVAHFVEIFLVNDPLIA